MIEVMKICRRCKEELDESKFCKNKLKKDGLNIYCLECARKNGREQYVADLSKRKRLKYSKVNYHKNKEKYLEIRKNYYNEHKEEISEYNKKYYQNNKNKHSKYDKKYYSKNKVKSSERSKERYQKNKNDIQRLFLRLNKI